MIKNVIWNFIASGLPKDHDIEELRKVVLINFFYTLAGLLVFSFSIITLLENNLILFTVDFTLGLFSIILILWLRKTKNPKYPSRLGVFVAGVFMFYIIISGGPNNVTYLWSFTFPLLSIFLLNTKRGAPLSLLLITLIVLVIVLSYFFNSEPLYPLPVSIRLVCVYFSIMFYAIIMEKTREIVQKKLSESNINLDKSFKEINALTELLPICYKCKKVRDDKGYWSQIENYIQDHSGTQFSHTLCVDCAEKEYSKEEWYKRYKEKQQKESNL